MAVFSVKGSIISIGGALAMQADDFEASDFTSQTWVPIAEPESMGTAGDAAAELTFDSVTAGRTRVLKGVTRAPAMELTFGADYADAGQAALRAAFLSQSDYAFKIELADKPSSGASPKNSQRLFIGKVMSINDTFDGIHKLTATVQPNSNIVAVNASAT